MTSLLTSSRGFVRGMMVSNSLRPQLHTPHKVINIDEEHLHAGKVQAWGPKGVSRQWLTRLEYLARSPYQVGVQ